MADEFSEFNRSTLPFRFTIPSAPLDPSVPRPGPYLFHGAGLQNPQYQHFSPATLQFMPAASSLGTSPSPGPSPASSSSASKSSENSPSDGSAIRNRCPNWSDAETRFLLEIWRENFPISPISKRRNSGAWDAIAKELNGILKEQGCQASALVRSAKLESNISKMNIRG